MSSIGAVPVVPARTWNPPPTSSTPMAWTNDPFDTVPVTSVNTTRVNIASVVPVRKRAARGYATDMRSTGVSARILPKAVTTRPSSRSALKTRTRTAPTMIMSPATIHVEKSIASLPNTASQRFHGSMSATTIALPQVV